MPKSHPPRRGTSLLVIIPGVIACALALLASDHVAGHAEGEDFGSWLAGEQQAFESYASAEDRAFSGFLRQQWQELGIQADARPYGEPKPSRPPVAPKAEPLPRPAPAPTPKPEPSPKTSPAVRPESRPESVPPAAAPEVMGGPAVRIDFFGVSVELPADRGLRRARLEAVSKDSIADFWLALSSADHGPLVAAVQRQARILALDGWGLLLLTQKAGEALFPGLPREQALTAWFLMVKSGVDVRAGYAGNEILLLVPFRETLYGQKFVRLGERKYSLIGASGAGRLYTYDKTHPEASHDLSLSVHRWPAIASAMSKRELDFSHAGQRHRLSVRVDGALAGYARNRPITDARVYLSAPLSDQANHDLYTALTPLLRGKSESEAVGLLLALVQALPYKTDEEQFGGEKPMFGEEALVYPFSDCEDRCALFACLVQNLLDLPVAGLHYPNHMATAVKFTGNVAGDAVTIQGERWVVCDPTYVGAPAGMAMPKFKSVKPEITRLNASQGGA